MGDIAKGVFAGTWSLLVGWIVPSALNLAVFLLAVAPTLQRTSLADRLGPGSPVRLPLLLLTGSVLIGFVLHASQNVLYRLLEGYILWPQRVFDWGCGRQLRIKHVLRDRIVAMRLEQRARDEGANDAAAARLARLRDDPGVARYTRQDQARSAIQRALLQERLSRYPISDEQVAPTRLGNAIRRLEEYGYERFRLDTQVMWHELTGCVPEQVRRQVELARTRVDFFIALLYGHGVVAACAAAALLSGRPQTGILAISIVSLSLLIPVWYWSATKATDEWAASVRSLVNLGRKPLAEALGYTLPAELHAERTMWTMLCRLSRLPYHERAQALDQFRASSSPPPV
ncbi:hypothetical protein E5083_05780 [Streptomyces bauhiniae]|uniref:Uncharacterized protein n=1 Tax=Streptomyces bauhiniae TaxID=2340725 RepID=A0A4Z1DA55_9ACTN|nr:hypothetical protein [Streptomyces bauhiniae]TGN79166.1 hypothetical protein E5083_05780 [Streptomyces bauhiniae]